MLDMVDVEYIRNLNLVQHWSVRQIAKQLGLSRNTVTKYLSAPDPTPRYRLAVSRPRPVLGAFEGEDRGLTGKRLVAFAMVCLGALAFAQFYNPEDLVSFALLATGTYLLIGESAEITSGAFHPLQRDYRFSGLMDPNNLAMNCAVLFFASLVSADSRKGNRNRALLLALSATVFLFLFLTKSRTTLAGATLALGAYWMLGASTYRKVAVFLGCIWVACCILLFLPDGAFVSISSKTIFPGRDISDISTLTGRTDIWKACLCRTSRFTLFSGRALVLSGVRTGP